MRQGHTWQTQPGHPEGALRLKNVLSGAWPVFRPAMQCKIQEELEMQAAALEEEIRHLRVLLLADCKRAFKDFWRRHAQDIVQWCKAERWSKKKSLPCPSWRS